MSGNGYQTFGIVIVIQETKLISNANYCRWWSGVLGSLLAPVACIVATGHWLLGVAVGCLHCWGARQQKFHGNRRTRLRGTRSADLHIVSCFFL